MGHGTSVWWLDVETINTWAGTQQENATVLDAMAARLQGLGVRVGIYSTPAMWEEIAGAWAPGLPIWYATGPATSPIASSDCANGFAGSTSAIVQWTQRDARLQPDHRPERDLPSVAAPGRRAARRRLSTLGAMSGRDRS